MTIRHRFTPLESPSIYAGDGKTRIHRLLIEGGVKALPCTILGSGPPLSNGVNFLAVKILPERNRYH
jgi:hypothetical protein